MLFLLLCRSHSKGSSRKLPELVLFFFLDDDDDKDDDEEDLEDGPNDIIPYLCCLSCFIDFKDPLESPDRFNVGNDMSGEGPLAWCCGG